MSTFLFSLLPLFQVQVKENSMNPFLKNGDTIIASKYFYQKPKVGEVVIFKHTTPPFTFIKRIVKIKDNKYWVEGDNKKESFDSKRFGFVDKEQIIGKMLFKI